MLTKVILEGAMGEKFGREWNLSVDSPNSALRLIDANRPGLFIWIRGNLQKYSHYRVICESVSGVIEEFDENQYSNVVGKYKSITFIPLIGGSGGNGGMQVVLGIVLIIVGVIFDALSYGTAGNWAIGMGVGMLIGGVVEMLSAHPKKQGDNSSEYEKKTSYFFNGPINTTTQGVPVQLIYGRVLVGSHTISATHTVEEVIGT